MYMYMYMFMIRSTAGYANTWQVGRVHHRRTARVSGEFRYIQFIVIIAAQYYIEMYALLCRHPVTPTVHHLYLYNDCVVHVCV